MPPLVVFSFKVALASGIAWELGGLLAPQIGLDGRRPFDAVLAVIILMQGHAYGSLLNALHFLAGVFAGLLLGILAATYLGLSGPVLAAIMFFTLLMGGWLKVSRLGFNNQIAISALLVLASGSSANIARLWETVLGGAVGVAVAALLWPPNPVSRLRDEFREASRRIKTDIMDSVRLAGTTADLEALRRRVREDSERVDAAVAEISPAEDALRWNPWHAGRMHDLSRVEERLRLVSYLYRTVRALARQAAEAPTSEDGHEFDWETGRPHLVAAAATAIEGIEKRLADQDVREVFARGRDEVARFAAAAPRERHAVAIAAALDDLLRDIEGWHPPHEVDPGQQLIARIVRRLGGRPPSSTVAQLGELEFEEERQQALRQDVAARVTRRRRTPPPLEDVVGAAQITDAVDRGERRIPIAQIKGTENRSFDFDASFQPRSRRLQQQWVQAFTLMEQGLEPPPIEVYQVGDVYFVKDGHIRVSVASHLGWETVRAHVTEVHTRAPVGSEINPHELLRAAEYARFLERTQLDVSRPGARLEVSQLGRYDIIFDHILGHRYFLGIERGHEVPIPEAAASWYDTVYRPVMNVARSHRVQQRLSGWTDTDIYLAVTRLWLDLEEEGLPAGPETAADLLLVEESRPGWTPASLWRRLRSRVSLSRWRRRPRTGPDADEDERQK
jgi:uncharacterized membrane protein YgaE (UPF0421/DUF939 family)